MFSIADKFRLIGFALAVKGKFANSVINLNLSASFMARTLSMSIATYKKYVNMAIKLKVLKPSGGHLQFISYSEIYKKFRFIESNVTHDTIRRIISIRDKSTFTFKDFAEFAREVVVLLHFGQQDYVISNKQGLVALRDALKNNHKTPKGCKTLNSVIRRAKKVGMSALQYLDCIIGDFNSEIITGSYKISTLLRLSQRTANRILNKLVDKDVISRIIVRDEVHIPVNHAAWDYMKITYPTKNFYAKRDLSGFVVIVGSIVSVLPVSDGSDQGRGIV